MENDVMMERAVRTEAVLRADDFMDVFCAHVANGGSPVDWCKERDIRYSDVVGWIGKSDDRKRAFSTAETLQAQWFVKSILGELRSIGLVDIRQAYEKDNKLKDIADIPENVARCIVSIETEELFEGFGRQRDQIGITKRVKFSDKLRALELLGKNLQMFIDTSRVIHTGRVTLEDLIMQSLDKPEAIEITPKEAPREIEHQDSKTETESGIGHGDGEAAARGV